MRLLSNDETVYQVFLVSLVCFTCLVYNRFCASRSLGPLTLAPEPYLVEVRIYLTKAQAGYTLAHIILPQGRLGLFEIIGAHAICQG